MANRQVEGPQIRPIGIWEPLTLGGLVQTARLLTVLHRFGARHEFSPTPLARLDGTITEAGGSDWKPLTKYPAKLERTLAYSDPIQYVP